MPRTVPVFPTEIPGNFITSALFGSTVGALGAWSTGSGTNGPPRFQGYSASSQSIATGITYISLTLDTEVYDSDGGHSTVTNTSRYTAQVAGTYSLSGSCGYAGTAGGNRSTRLAVNGVGVQGSQVAAAPTTTANSWYGIATAFAVLNVGDFVEVQTWQNSGAAINTNGGLTTGPTLNVLWVSS